ncbi:hypothetical protein BST37_18770 [Mycobacterium noviomagense]|uniref:Uncharacterized protein n=1 Tax=Mycobacterium noviomagense TaxID=459858 RepID=A0ABX3T1X0_9MYCO|nr:hypothetical protein BST37_18770 [Mycobacterium noviomagense]
MYQPRGVGLIHPRHRPSNAYYTRDSPRGRKCCLQEKAEHPSNFRRGIGATHRRPQQRSSRSLSTPFAACRTITLCWAGDRRQFGRTAANLPARTGAA